MNRRIGLLRLLGFVVTSAWLGQSLAADESGLEAALAATLMHHPAISGKRAEVQAKGFAGDSARAQRYPSVSAQASAQDKSDQFANRYPKTLRARQPLWAFGRIDSNIAYADADKLAEEVDLLRVKRQLLEQTAVAYARVLGVQQRLTVAEDNIAALEKLYQQIQRRERGQLASMADVRLALARFTQARAQRERYDGELAVARNELLALTQVEVAAGAPVPLAFTELPSLEEQEATALEHSADLLLKRQRIEVAHADANREKVAPMPTLYLQGDRYFNQPAYGDDFRASVVIEANVEGMGFGALGRTRAALARVDAANEDLNAARTELRRNLRTLHTNRQLQQALKETQQQSITELTEILSSYKRQYESGQKSWLEVLNMQRELTEQRQQLAQIDNEWLINTLKLRAISGGLDALAGDEKDITDVSR